MPPPKFSRYDHLLIGLATAWLVAGVAYALLLYTEDYLSTAYDQVFNFRTRSLALIAICLNVVPMNYFRKRYRNRSLRGLVIGTFLLAVVWFIYFGQDLLNGVES